MSHFFTLNVRIPVVAIWLSLALLTSRYPVARRVLAPLAGATVGLYLGVLIGGLLENWIAPPHGSVPVPFFGMLVGGACGGVVGLIVGLMCAGNNTAYWALQYTAAAVVLLVPLK